MLGSLALSLVIAGAVYLILTQPERDRAAKVNPMPELLLHDLEGRLVTDESFSPDKKKVIVFFSTGCSFCVDQITGMRDAIQDFDGVEVMLVSKNEEKELLRFKDYMKLQDIEEIKILKADPLLFSDVLDINIVPTTLVYEEKGELIERIEGLAGVEELVGVLE